jgi:acyl carrier protein
MSKIAEIIKRIIDDHLIDYSGKFEERALLIEDLRIDSLTADEILIDLEDTFNIKIPEIDAKKIKTVENLIRYIEVRLKKKAYTTADRYYS